MKKTVLFAIVALTLCLLPGCSKKTVRGEFTVEAGKLKIGCEVGYPPFEYYSEDGKTALGFDIELGNEIARRLSLEPQVIDTAWDGIFAGLDTERYDIIISAVSVLPERQEKYDFSVPYIGNGQAVIVRKDSELKVNTLKDLEGKKLAYQSQCSSDFFINKKAEEERFSFIPCSYDKILNAYDDLRLGRADAVISDTLVAIDYLTAENSEFKQVWKGVSDDYFGICAKKGNKVLVEKINSIIEEMKADGTMKALYEKVFKMDLSDSIR